jgi:PAS domain S-box-containing protein
MKRIKGPGTRVKFIFLIATVCLFALSVFSYFRIKSLGKSAEIVNHTNLVKLELERTVSILKEAESSQRGYMLTRDPVFLTPYRVAIHELQQQFDKLEKLTKDNPTQAVYLAALKTISNKRIAYLQFIIDHAKAGNISNERWLEGKEVMDQAKDNAQQMMNEEDNLLRVRLGDLSRNIYITPLLTILLIIFSLLILVYAYSRIAMELNTSYKLQEQLALQIENLAESEERYHMMVEEVTDYAIILLDKDGFIENWNKGAQNIKGYEAAEIIGRNFSLFYPETDRNDKLPQRLIAEANTKGRAVHEGWRVRKNGTYFWGSVAITALRDRKGKTFGFTKVTRDLTEKKIAEDNIKRNAEILEKKNVDLENMNKELQSFAYVSSHDLQEPLRKIQTFSDRILEMENENLSARGKDYFNRMREAAKRMQVLIEDLLSYARTNVTERKFESMNLSVTVDAVKNELKEIIEAKDAKIETGNLCTLRIIPFQFNQLFHNLMSNALKFSRPGVSPVIRIDCSAVSGNSIGEKGLIPFKKYIHIRFSDNGIGFEQQYSDRIFEIFQRLHGRDQFKGTGIGLSICKKIVENHHGIITAHGEIDKGATFDIYIPAD